MSSSGSSRLEHEQLRGDEVRDLVVDLLAEEDDPLAQEPRVDVERPLAAAVGLDHHRDERHVTCNLTVAILHATRRLHMEVTREIVLEE